jgi:hypothetical protein
MRIAFTFACICALISGLFAQTSRKEEVYNKLEEVGRFKKWEKSFEFKAGEEIILNIETTDNRKLNRVRVLEPNSTMHQTAIKQRFVDKKRMYVQRDGVYTFQVRNRGILGRSFNIKIERIKRMIELDTLYLDDVMFSSRIDTLMESFVDTVAIPDVGVHEFYLSPLVDVSRDNDSCIVEELLEDSFQYATYWVGVGKESLLEYEKLKQNPPPAWSLSQTNEPIVAYGLRLTDKLPMNPIALSKDVVFRFQSPADADKQLSPTSKRSPFYGFIPLDKALKYKKLKLCIKNFNSGTGVPIYIKIAKFKIEKGRRPKVIIRERSQEIYIKDKYELVEPDEE